MLYACLANYFLLVIFAEIKNKITNILAVLIVVCTTSCATVFDGTKDRIVINTIPPGADVLIDGENKGKSGQDILLDRKYVNNRSVELRKDGYEVLQFKIDQKISGTYWLNFVTNLGVFALIDIGTGAAMKPKQTEFNRVLTPKEGKKETENKESK